jgi:hypothetical protein
LECIVKRTPLVRKTTLARGKGLRRVGRLRPHNRKRREKAFARNFGDEAEAVRTLPCLCRGRGPFVRRFGPVTAAHVKSRGASGGRFDLVPLCQAHHDEQHAVGVETFAASYGLDLRAAADRVALEHVRPLGIGGLVDAWIAGRAAAVEAMGVHGEGVAERDLFEWAFQDDEYGGNALLGWVRRWLAACDPAKAATRPGLALALSGVLGIHQFDAFNLCEAAGWPEPSVTSVERVVESERQLPEGWSLVPNANGDGASDATLVAKTDDAKIYADVRWDGEWSAEVYPLDARIPTYQADEGTWTGTLADGCDEANKAIAKLLAGGEG